VSDVTRALETTDHAVSPFAAVQSALTPASDDARNVVREGLPPTYRMRADAHYVDELDTPAIVRVQMIRVQAIEDSDDTNAIPPSLVDSVRQHGVIEPLIVQKRERRYRLIAGMKRLAAARQAGLQEVPCLVRRIDDDEAKAVAAALRVSQPRPNRERHVAETGNTDSATNESRATNLRLLDDAIAASLSAVVSSTSLLTESGPQLARAVARDLICAEGRRARALFQVAQALRNGVVIDRRVVAAAAVVQDVVDMLEAEAQLRRFTVTTEVDVAESTVIRVNQELLASALFGGALMIAASLACSERPVLTVTATREPAGQVALSVTQRSVPVPATWPRGADVIDAVAVAPLVALRHVAEACGGVLFTTRLSDGARLALNLPIADERRL